MRRWHPLPGWLHGGDTVRPGNLHGQALAGGVLHLPSGSIRGRLRFDVVQDMHDWYNARVEEPLDEVFRQLQNTLFKNVIAPVEEDVWRRRDPGGASQPAAQGETHLVVTREHVARQVGLVIRCRERWLEDHGLAMETKMRHDVATRFLNDAKKDFHDSAEQQALQENDRRNGKRVQQGKHSRWSRHVQRLGGTKHMWTLLSFKGRFDPVFLEESMAKGEKNPTTIPGCL